MNTLLNDLRYAARRLQRAPGFTLIVTLTLALGIGATTAIFSVVNGVLLAPLPFREPERLVRVATTARGAENLSSPLDFLDYRTNNTSLAGLVAYDRYNLSLTSADRGAEPQRLDVGAVTADFFGTLGTTPALGRGFAAGEDAVGAPPVVVLSDGLWRSRFAADPRVVGRTVTLDARDYTVVGVARAGLTFPERYDAIVPLVFDSSTIAPDNRGAHSISLFGRLKPGVTVERARADLAAIAARLAEQYPQSNTGFGATVAPLQENLVRDVKPALWILLGAVAFVLLIACANVANLLLVRVLGRGSELAVRTGLGAGRGRIVRQLVTESVVLAAVGGLAGVLLAANGVRLLVALAPDNLPRLHEVTLDVRVLAVAAAVTIGVGFLVGLAPALSASHADVASVLREGARGSSSGAGQRLRGSLVVGEMALAVLLLTGAGLLIRSFTNLMRVDVGFVPEHVVTFTVDLPEARYERVSRQQQFGADLQARLAALPGVQSAAAVAFLPMSGRRARTSLEIAGLPPSDPGNRRLTEVDIVTPGYFATMGIPVVRGADFTAADRSGRPQKVIVNRALAQKYFPGEDPIGRRVTIGVSSDTADVGGSVDWGGEIVAVVGDVRQQNPKQEATPMTYLPLAQAPWSSLSAVVRTTADPAGVLAAARAQLRQIDPDLAMYAARTMDDVVGRSVAQPRFYTLLLALFAGIALALAAVGIYGVLSYAVRQRTRELGIRVALGAPGGQIARLVLGQGLRLTLAGLAIGVVAAYYVTRLLAGLLFGVQPGDVGTFAGGAVVLFGVALAATYVPARRAARVDPLTAMKAD
jgi:putative ABC transport system permease protein